MDVPGQRPIYWPLIPVSRRPKANILALETNTVRCSITSSFCTDKRWVTFGSKIQKYNWTIEQSFVLLCSQRTMYWPQSLKNDPVFGEDPYRGNGHHSSSDGLFEFISFANKSLWDVLSFHFTFHPPFMNPRYESDPYFDKELFCFSKRVNTLVLWEPVLRSNGENSGIFQT